MLCRQAYNIESLYFWKEVINIKISLKRFFPFALISVMLFLVASCGDISTSGGNHDINGNSATDNQADDNGMTDNLNDDNPDDNHDNSGNVSGANIQIDYATDELLGRYESFHEFIHEEEGGWLVIWTDVPVKDFAYIKVGYDIIEDNVVFFADYVVYPIGELTLEKPFKVKTYAHYGTIPHYGISFTDANNEKKYFYINESGMDGSLLLVEFENKNGE